MTPPRNYFSTYVASKNPAPLQTGRPGESGIIIGEMFQATGRSARRKRTSDASLFIIESLGLEDERNNLFEGRILRDILALSQKHVEYMYIRTRRELEAAMMEFDRSHKRYLHLSCHGNDQTVALTLDSLTFTKFSGIVGPHLKNRRLFVSACEVVSTDFARTIFPNFDCYSVIGPSETIGFGDAALMWASFYHLIFRIDPAGMNRQGIEFCLKKVCDTFEVPFKYHRKSNKQPGFSTTDFPLLESSER
jgi:hypothetical protein